MITYKDLKSVSCINEIIIYVQDPLNVRFKRYGQNNYAAFCPFHNDTKDSFRVYVKDKEDVRFHCFGACNAEWDVYNLIMLRKGCSFKQAQIELAALLGVDEFELFHGKSDSILEQEEEPDEPLNLSEPEELTPELREVLDRATEFYHSLLMSDGKQFVAIRKYLYRRGVDEKMIRDFNIGYCPPFKNENFNGRALLDNYLDHFMSDRHVFSLFCEAGLFRLLNDESVAGYGFYRRQIDSTRKDPFQLYLK